MAEYDITVLCAEHKAHVLSEKSVVYDGVREIVRAWEGIPPRYLTAIAADIRALLTRTNPKVDQRQESGTWAIAVVSPERSKAGDGIVTETLRLIESPANVTALAALKYRVLTEVAALDALSLFTGSKVDYAVAIPNLAPTSEATVRGFADGDLTTAFAPSGSTYISRKWEPDEFNATCTLTIMWSKPTWEKTASNKVQMGEAATSGHSIRERHVVEGVPKANRATLLTDLKTPGDNRVISLIQITDKGDGSLAATREVAQASGAEGEPVIVQLKNAVGTRRRGLARTWARRDTTRKEALIAASGTAVSDLSYTWPGEGSATTFTTDYVVIEDHGDGAWTVTQHLVDNGTTVDAVDGEHYFEKHTWIYHIQNRATDNYTRIWKMALHTAVKSSRKKAWAFIGTGVSGNGVLQDYTVATPAWGNYSAHVLIEGTAHVTRFGPYFYHAQVTSMRPYADSSTTPFADITGVRDWVAMT